jgi:hypothetical protein
MALLVRPSRTSSRVIAAGLAASWVWTGIAYHAMHFSAINHAAYGFAALFVGQGVLLLYFGVATTQIRFDPRAGSAPLLGWALLAYAMVIYPLIGLASEHRRGELPVFGITPCPVTLFTFGFFLLATEPVPRWLLAIPMVWSLIGGSAAFLLGVPQDWALLFSGLACCFFSLRHSAPRKLAQRRSGELLQRDAQQRR